LEVLFWTIFDQKSGQLQKIIIENLKIYPAAEIQSFKAQISGYNSHISLLRMIKWHLVG
jgi:hypothetical protein